MAVFLTQDETTTQENITRTLVKKMLASAKLPLTKAVNIMNQMHPDNATTPQNINNKLTADSIKFIEVARLADICGYQVIFRPKDAVNWADETPAKSAPQKIPTATDPEEDKPVKAPETNVDNDSFGKLVILGYASCRSINFNTLLIAGKRANDAAAWIEKNLVEGMSETQEIFLYLAANREFHVIVKPTGIDGQFTML